MSKPLSPNQEQKIQDQECWDLKKSCYEVDMANLPSDLALHKPIMDYHPNIHKG